MNTGDRLADRDDPHGGGPDLGVAPTSPDDTLRALAEAEEHLALVLETANDAFVGMDQNGQVIGWNRRAEELFGWSTDIIGRELAETIVPPAYRDQHRRGLARYLATGEGTVLFQRVQLPALRRDGQEFHAEITIWPSRHAAGTRFNAFVRDVTDQRRTQAMVDLLQRVTRTANETDDLASVTATAVEEVCRVTGWPVGHAYLVDPTDPERLVPTGHRCTDEGYRAFEAASELLAFRSGEGLPGRVLADRRPAWISDLASDPNFPRRPVAEATGVRSAFAFPVLAGDRVVAVLEFFTTAVTEPDPVFLEVMGSVGTQLGRVAERERAAAELAAINAELVAAVRAQGQLVSTVAHELGSPLAAITGFAGLILQDWDQLDPATIREHVGAIERQAARLARLVRDLLTVSGIQSGQVRPDLVRVDLRAAADEVVGDLRLGEVLVDVAPGTEVQADPDHVTQILVNLLRNAHLHGSPPVTVEASRRGGDVVLTVTDAGPGLADPEVAFEAFTRGGHTTVGTGLGLSIVRGLARANGGDAWHESPASGGTRMRVRLPAG